MSTRFFTNVGEQTLFRKLKGVFESNPDLQWFDAVIGYLRASGYFAIRPYLEKIPQIRILVGINVDAIMADYHKRGLLFLADPTKALEEFKTELRKDIQTAAYSREVEAGILQFVDDVLTKRIELRAHPTKRLHAKLYIFRPKGFNEHKPGAVITGSSNLTAAGLGTNEEVSNYEFNVLLHDYDDVKFATEEFERLWAESVSILPKALEEVRDSTYLTTDVTPHDLYWKLLTEYFGASIEYDPNAVTDLPDEFKRLAYQIDAVNSGYRLLEKHNGFFLADVVGLGKTVIAVLIAKKFYFHNGFPSHRSNTLIVVPPALEDNWEWTKEKFRLDNVKIITNGSIHKVRHPEKFDLVIVDEAHKFRNDTAEAFDDLQRLCKTPVQRADGTTAPKKVILVSATPLNNKPADLANQIALFQDLRDSTLTAANLRHFFAQREQEYRDAKREDIETARRQVKTIYERIRTEIISEVTIRRTRKDLVENDQYKQDLIEQGVVFPKVEKPRAIYYPLAPALEDLYDRTMLQLTRTDNDGLTYNRYRAIQFLKPEKKQKYQNADRISAQLAFIMRTLLVKRLDSSFHAFRQSLHRFRDATRIMLEMFDKKTIYIAPNLNVTEFLIEGREEELIAKIEHRQATDPTITICKPDDFEPGFVDGLRADYEKLVELCDKWDAVQDDPKLDVFLDHLKRELFSHKINHGHRLVIFSEAKDTTEYLQKRLAEAGYDRVLTVDSHTRKDRMPAVQANFDANLPANQQLDNFDILLSTEILSEGVNLHRANVIVNYDTPWNATRLMQRVGRVNRIGATAPKIYIYNFYPTAKVDDDIELKKKAIMKLQAFHTALGEDSQIYSETEEVENFGLFELAPEDQDRDERLQLLMELRRFRHQHPDQFRRIQKLPLRARVGRADAQRAGSTATFIRSHRRDGFYRVTGDGKLEEITILEAAEEFRAPDSKEKAIPLHAAHHDHVNSALTKFKELAVAAALNDQTVQHQPSPNERKALEYLDSFLGLPILGEDEKNLIQAAKLALRRARFQDLQRKINNLQRSVRTVQVAAAIQADKLIAILREYPLLDQDQQPVTTVNPKLLDTPPDIILSESFDHPPKP
jgi:superfamily II DNA or RNA helicase